VIWRWTRRWIPATIMDVAGIAGVAGRIWSEALRHGLQHAKDGNDSATAKNGGKRRATAEPESCRWYMWTGTAIGQKMAEEKPGMR